MNNLFIIEGPAGFSVRHNSTNREVRFLLRSDGWNRENAELVAMVADDIIEIRLRQEVEEAEGILEENAELRGTIEELEAEIAQVRHNEQRRNQMQKSA